MKFEFISLLHVSSMILIIFFHSLCYYAGTWSFLCSDVVPLWEILSQPIVKTGLTTFVLVSGYLFGFNYIEKRKYRILFPFIKDKVRRLIIPYIVWSVIMIVFFPQLNLKWINILTGIAHLWFLLMLFQLFIVMFFLCRHFLSDTSRLIDIIFLSLSFPLVYLWGKYSSHQYFLNIRELLYYFPAFLIGFFCAKYKILNILIQKRQLLFLLIATIVILILISASSYAKILTLYRIPSITVSILSIALLKKTTLQKKTQKWVNHIEKNSMGIYIFNQIIVFIILYQPTLNLYFINHIYIGPFIIFILSFLIPWGLATLFNHSKYTSWMIGTV